MPPKKKPQSDTATRHQKDNQRNDNKKPTTNLKDLLKRTNSSLKRESGIEKDGDFIFKRTNSQLESESQNNRTTRSKNQKNDKRKIRKLTTEDMSVTPIVNRVNDTYQEHSTSIQLALPISDSPIVRKNKDTSRNRRSSLNNRGKRVSSIGNGFNGVPHEQIPTNEYHKHLDSDLPDPHKMRQLLIWCSKKKFDEDNNRHIRQKNKLANEELTALNIAKVIKEEIVRDLVDGKINVSWWNRSDEKEEGESTSLEEPKIIPNERNLKNQQVLKDLAKRLLDLKAKTAEWENESSEKIRFRKPKLAEDDLKSFLAHDENFSNVLNNSVIEEMTSIEDSTVNDITSNLEPDVDLFNDYAHKLKSASSIRSKFTSLKSQKLSEILDTTFNDDTLDKIQQSEVNRNIDTRQLLKGISKLDRGDNNENL